MTSATESLQSVLEGQGFAMLDGGLATELENRGADLDHFLWSARLLAESPERIRDVHLDYLAAGADVIATASYQASFSGFGRAGHDRARAQQLMCLSVRLAEEARDAFWSEPANRAGRHRPLIAASIGPYGACLHDGSEYHGQYGVDRDAVRGFHRERLDVLADTSADLFAFETIPSQEEGEVLVELLGDYPGWSAWLSFSCRDGRRVSHGETMAACAALAEASDQIVAVGINCTSPQYVNDLLDAASATTQKPLVAYPNRGEQYRADQNRWFGEACSSLAATDWYQHGARLLGGCCRTGPDDIRAMRSDLQRLLN